MIARLWSFHWTSPDLPWSGASWLHLKRKGGGSPVEILNHFHPCFLCYHSHTGMKALLWSSLTIHCVFLARWCVILAGCKVGILPALPEGTDILTLPFSNIAWERSWGMTGLHTLDCRCIYWLCIVQAGCINSWLSSLWYTMFFYRLCDT